MSRLLKGTIYTIVAGIAWGLSGTSGQYLMAHGISAILLTNIRLIIAGLLLVIMAYARSKEQLLAFVKDRDSLKSLLLFSLFGLFLNQFSYLAAILETNAGTATVLQHVCPVGILLYTCIKDRVAPTIAEIISIVLAIGGTFLIATHGQLHELSMTPAGLFWGLFFSIYLCAIHYYPNHFDSEMGQYASNWNRNAFLWNTSFSLYRSLSC